MGTALLRGQQHGQRVATVSFLLAGCQPETMKDISSSCRQLGVRGLRLPLPAGRPCPAAPTPTATPAPSPPAFPRYLTGKQGGSVPRCAAGAPHSPSPLAVPTASAPRERIKAPPLPWAQALTLGGTHPAVLCTTLSDGSQKSTQRAGSSHTEPLPRPFQGQRRAHTSPAAAAPALGL